MISFGDALKKFREERGLSLRELDKLSGVSYAYIQRLENNDRIAPSTEKIDSLMAALKLSPQRKEVLRYLLLAAPVPDALFEAIFRNSGISSDAFMLASKMSFRGSRPSSVEDWESKLSWIDKDVLQNGGAV
jgi:transcriptional regulator with XRE-family HTH domain